MYWQEQTLFYLLEKGTQALFYFFLLLFTF